MAFFSAWLGGLKGGIGGTAIGALLVWFVFIPPQFSFELQNPSGGFSIAVFVVMGCLFAWFHEKLQRALGLSEVRFEASFERADIGVVMMTPEGRLLRANPKFCAITGYSAGELTAKSFKDITHPADLEVNVDHVRRCLSGEIDRFSIERRFIRKDGRHVWVSLTVSLVRNSEGTPDYFIAVVEDITILKAAERRFVQLLQKAPVALSTSDRTGRILLMNSAFLEMFGYRIEDTPPSKNGVLACFRI